MLISVSILAVGGVLWWLWKLGSEHLVLRVALGLVLGGAIGNLIDRVSLGYVIDFIDWHLRQLTDGPGPFPSTSLTLLWFCGGALILIFGGKAEGRTEKNLDQTTSDDETFTEAST